MEIKNKKVQRTFIEHILFSSKWMLIPFYLGLMIALGIFSYVDLKEIYHLFHNINGLNEEDGMMVILKLIDMTMIANLVKMMIVGSYTSFYKKHVDEDGNTDPNSNTSSGVLKVKMATSLIGLTSINLLQAFIKPEGIIENDLRTKLIIHVSFMVGALVLAIIDWLHVKSEAIHHEDCIKHKI